MGLLMKKKKKSWARVCLNNENRGINLVKQGRNIKASN